jgi:hypothetical protein
MGPGSVMNAISRISPPHAWQSSGNSSATRAISFAHAIRESIQVSPGELPVIDIHLL